MRFIVILVLAAFLVGLMWPHLSKLKLGREPVGVAVARKSEKFFLACMACIILSLVVSTLLWWFGH